jgi:glycosyltransferase involved in cell wall biosynthesis
MEGAFFTFSSTACVNREVGRHLAAGDQVALAIRPLEEKSALEEDTRRFALLQACRDLRFKNPSQVYVWHQWPPSAQAPLANRWVVWQGWEYGSLPKKIFSLLQQGVDEIWTYSNYCRQEFVRDGLPEEKVRVIPLGVDPERFHPEARVLDRLEGLTNKKVSFLFVGGTIWRKGIDLLLSAFCRAFTARDDVALVVKEMGSDTFYQDYNLTGAVERLADMPDAPKIVLLRDELEDGEMPGLYRACTALVHPYRGEGFGLPVLEAMACGLPVIVSRGGACDDFLPLDSPLLIPAKQKRIPLPMETVRPPWVLDPDTQALGRVLRAFAADPSRARVRAVEESRRIRTQWTWERSAAAIEARCKDLAGQGTSKPPANTPKTSLSFNNG